MPNLYVTSYSLGVMSLRSASPDLQSLFVAEAELLAAILYLGALRVLPKMVEIDLCA